MAIDTTEHLRAAEEGIRARIAAATPNSRRLTFALEAVLSAQRLWADAIALERPMPEGSAVTRMPVPDSERGHTHFLGSSENRGTMDERCANCGANYGHHDNGRCPSSEARRRFTARRVERENAGGPLWAPVDQFGMESGDTPSYDSAAIRGRCAELNAAPPKVPPAVTGPNGECQICGAIPCKPGCEDGSEIL